jgi:HSP20 family protein
MRQILTSFVELMHLQSEMNKLFEALQDLHQHSDAPDLGAAPPYDILETPDALLVEMDLPGADPASLRVTIRGAHVTVAGERRRGARGGIKGYHLMERDCGAFSRRLRVEGSVNTHRCEATYRQGVLTLTFPRVPDRRGATIEIPVQLSR